MLDRPAIRIVRAADGGPMRRILTGRATKPTGSMPCTKASGRGMPWESARGERPLLLLCEVGTPVASLMAQPHRVDMPIAGSSRPLQYIPDTFVTAGRAFVESVLGGEKFGPAILDWSWDMPPDPADARLVIEVGTAADRRKNERAYRDKIELVRDSYARAGYAFLQVDAERDLDCVDLTAARRVYLRRGAAIDAVLAHRAIRYLNSAARRACLGGLVEAIGASASVAFALHVRRLISIDLRGPLKPSTGVRLVPRPEEE